MSPSGPGLPRSKRWQEPVALALATPLAALGLWSAPRIVLAWRSMGGPVADYRFGAADQLGSLGRLGAVALGGLLMLLAFSLLATRRRADGGAARGGPNLGRRLATLLTVAALRLAGALLLSGLLRLSSAASGYPVPQAPLLGAVGLWSVLSVAALPLAALGRPAAVALAESVAWAGSRPGVAAGLLAVEWLTGALILAGRDGAHSPGPRPEMLAALPLALWDPGARPLPPSAIDAGSGAAAFALWISLAWVLLRASPLPSAAAAP